MKRFLKWLGILLVIFILLIFAGVIYINTSLPNVGDAPEMTIEVTPERVERGHYLANSVAVCMDCHSTRDWSKFSAPLVEGTLGKGGERFDQTMGFPGVYYSKNITPFNLKDWTDGELFRVITTGVTKSGEPIFPVMPYHYYGRADEEDVKSIIAYIRTLPEIQSEVQESKSDFPFNLIVRTIPKPAELANKPSPADTLAYGAYLTNMAACRECHTKEEKGQLIAGTEFGGGRVFMLPGGKLVSANISPDESGIGDWSREAFIERFKAYADSGYTAPNVGKGDFNTIMPWMMYASMTESDLASIYEYLRTVTPINNNVEFWTPNN